MWRRRLAMNRKLRLVLLCLLVYVVYHNVKRYKTNVQVKLSETIGKIYENLKPSDEPMSEQVIEEQEAIYKDKDKHDQKLRRSQIQKVTRKITEQLLANNKMLEMKVKKNEKRDEKEKENDDMPGNMRKQKHKDAKHPVAEDEKKNSKTKIKSKKKKNRAEKNKLTKNEPKPAQRFSGESKDWTLPNILKFINTQLHRFEVKHLTAEDLRPDQPDPIILVWTANAFATEHKYDLIEYKYPNVCGGCVVTMDRSVLNRSKAVVLFFSPERIKKNDFPPYRKADQLYVFWHKETPSKSVAYKDLLKDKRLDKVFNFTINYRRDSSFPFYFGNHETALRESYKGPRTWKKTDRKLALWIVSNCNRTLGARERMNYAKELMKAGLKLDAKGKCFPSKKKESFTYKLAREYKFYLSFDNSIHCPDYVSEKMWRNAIVSGTVPVVWGPTREDVKAIAPLNSYIHVDDFSSPAELVKYLNYLDKNQTAYAEYHKWREEPLDTTINYEDIKPGDKSPFCRLCKTIRKPMKPGQYKIPSVYNWLYEDGYTDDICLKSEL